jgi:maltose alpha-D-glucosyltransferase/alpha-amylase
MFHGYIPVELFSKNKFPTVKEGQPYFFTIGAHECLWFDLQKVKQEADTNKELPTLALARWDSIIEKEAVDILEGSLLINYMMKLRWFGGKGRVVENIKIINYAKLPLEDNSVYLLLIEVTYESGLPETYQLPIAFAKDALAAKLEEFCPKSVIAKLKVNDALGILYDAVYGLDFQMAIINNMAHRDTVNFVRFMGNDALTKHVQSQEKIKPKVLSGEQSNTSIIYDNKFFLKLFRKVDPSINPDVEISHYLSEHANFEHIPKFVGTIEWKSNMGTMVLAMMQEVVESSSDAWTYMLDRLDAFNEKVISTPDIQLEEGVRGTLFTPVEYDDIPQQMKELIGGDAAELTHLLGIRTGEMHKSLSAGKGLADFRPEDYSLHYQRSLFAGLQSLVRSTFQNQMRNMRKLSDQTRKEAEEVLAMKDEILAKLKNIYKNKIDVSKIRIHGDYHLGQVLFTGKDFVITDFEGEPARTYSERRLKRCALRDVAGMIRSFHYAAYGSLFLDNQIRQEDFGKLMPFVEQWYHYMSGIFMNAYLESVEGTNLIPDNKQDLETLMTTFLLEKAIYELNYELNNRPDWLIIPLRGIKALMKKETEKEIEVAVV